MKRLLAFTAAILLAVATLAVPASPPAAAAEQSTCPPTPPPGSQVNGGLLVTGPCTLSDVTVNGGATVTSTGRLELENNTTIHGGVTVQPGGELDAGHTISSDTATFTPNTIDGGIDMTNGLDLDLDNATVNGSVSVTGTSPGSFPTMCGSTFHGSVTVSGINAPPVIPSVLGDPGEPFQTGPHTDCPGNTFHGTVFVSNSQNVEIEGNTIHGSVFINNSKVGFSGNTITGSTHCQNVIPVVDADDAPSQCS